MLTKICGIQNKETLLCCEENNVDFFGMIFFNKSPRNITLQKAKELQNLSLNMNINGVGVFVNEDIDIIKNYIEILKLKYVQLHGEEKDKYIEKIKKKGVQVIKTISIKTKYDLDNLINFENTDYFLFDYKPNIDELPGGNAKSFDWNIIKSLEINKPWFLSGGINQQNIHLVRRNLKPFGVDLSSGVEKELGIKDNGIINNFMDKLNNA